MTRILATGPLEDLAQAIQQFLQHSSLSLDNSLEALFMEVLNCVNRAGHPVIYFTGFLGVFSPYSPGLERY